MANKTTTKVPRTTWAKNISKSLAYSSIQVMKSFTPSITGSIESFHETSRELAVSVKQMIPNLKKGEKVLETSENAKTVKKILRSARDDLKTGNLSLAKDISDIEDDFEAYDDYDYDTNKEPDESATDNSEILHRMGSNMNSAIQRGAIANVRGMHTMTETLANVQIRTSEASSRKLSEAILYQTNVLYNAQTETNQILRNIDANIIGMSTFMNDNISKTNQAMLTFMENTETILKDIKEQRSLPSRKSNRRRSSLFNDDNSFISETGIDFQKLIEVKKKDLKDGSEMSELSMMIPMVNMIADMGEGIRLPQMILESGILPNIIPKKYRRGLKDLDKNFSSNLESVLEMLGSKTFISDGTFKGGIKTTVMKGLQKVLGIKPTYAKMYDAANFSKEEMGWNGYAQKALVDVIPSYLANIEIGIAKMANLTASDLQKARRFDYKSGRFMTKLEITNEARKGFERTISSSYSDLINYVNEQMSSEMGLSEDNQDVILAKLNQIMKKGIRGGGRDSDRLAREIQREFGQVFNNVQMSNIFNLASQGNRKAKQDMRRFYENMETSDQGHNVFRTLSENSDYDFFDLDKGEDFNFTRKGYSLHDIERSFRRDFPQYIDEVRFGRRAKNVRPDILSVYRKYLDAVTQIERDRLRQHLEDMITDHVQMVNDAQNSKIKKAINRIISPLVGNEEDRTVVDDINDKLSKILAFNQFNDNQFDNVNFSRYTNNAPQQNRETLNSNIRARQSSAPQGQWITEHTASENVLVRIIPDKLDAIIQLLEQRYTIDNNNPNPSNSNKRNSKNKKKRHRKLKGNNNRRSRSNNQQLRQNLRMNLQLFGNDNSLDTEDNKLRQQLISALDDTDSNDDTIIESLLDDINDDEVETGEIVRQLPAIITTINSNRSEEEERRLLVRSGISLLSRPQLDDASRENAEEDRRNRQNEKTKKAFDSLFNLENGKLKGISRKVRNIKDYTKYHITGKGYTDIDGAEYEDLAENESVAGRLKQLKNKMFDMTAQYLTGQEDYRNTNTYQSMLHILDPNNQTKLGQLSDQIENPQDIMDAAIMDAAVQTDIRLIEAGDSEVEVLFGDVLPADTNGNGRRNKVEETKRKLTSSLSKKWRNLIPKVGTGIAVGAGIGALAGSGSLGLLGSLFFDGGIIPGAIVGGGLTFLNSFQNVNDVIFGKKDEQTGDRTGGIISNKLQKSFKKYLPAVVGGGVLGAVKGIFGGSQAVGGLLGATKGGIILNQLLPGGIVGGALLGMGAGILKQSGFIQRLLFGKKADTESGEKRSYGLIGKAFTDENKKFIKKGVKGLGIGAITGLTLSNMGILGGALSMGGPIGMGIAGLGMGILSNSEKFSRLLFGDREIDKDGNLLDTRKGGLTGALIDTFKTSIGQRISDKMDNALELTKLYALEYLGKPLHKVIDPIANTVKRLGEDTKEAITTAFDDMAHTVGTHIKGITENVFGKVTNFVGRAARFGIGLMSDQTKSVFKAVALPFKAAGLLTSGMRNRQEEEIRQLGINKGTALLEDKWRQEDEENDGEAAASTRLNRASELINLKKNGWRNIINENYDSLDDNQKRIVDMMNLQKKNYKSGIKEAKAKGRKLQEVNDFTRKFVKENKVRSFRDISDETKDKYIQSLKDMGLGKYYDLDRLQTGEDVKNFIFNRKDWLDSHKRANTQAIESSATPLALEDKSMIRTTEYQNNMEQRTDTVIEILNDIRRASNANNELISGGSYDSSDPDSNFSGNGNVKDEIVDEAHLSEEESKNNLIAALAVNRRAELVQRRKDEIIAREAEETEVARNGAKTKHDEAEEIESDDNKALTEDRMSNADTEEKSGIFSTISKWAMRVLGIGTLGIFGKELISLGKKYVFPIVKKAGAAIGSAIWDGVKSLTGSFFDDVVGWINGKGKKDQSFDEEKQAEATGQNYFYDEKSQSYIVPASDKYFDDNGKLQSTEKGSISSKIKTLGRNFIPHLGHADEAVKFGTRAGKLAGKFMKIPASMAGLAGKILHIPGLKHINGKNMSKVTGKIGGAIGGALSGIAHTGSMATKAFSSSMKLGSGVKKAVLNTGDYVLSTAKSQFANMIAAFGKKILSFATNSKLLNICTKHGFESSVLGKLLKSLVDAMTSLASKAGAKVTTYTKMMEEAAAQSVGKVGLTVGTAGLSTAAFAIYDFTSGLFEADKLFNVNSDDVTLGMRMISAILKAILGYDTLVVLDIVIEIMSDIAGKDFKCIAATAMYKCLNSLVPGGVGVAAIEALDTAQSVMDIETLIYNQRNGTNLSTSSYSDKKDNSWIGKIWNTVTGKEKAYKENEDIAKVLYKNGFRNTDKGLVDSNGNVWNIGDAIAKYKESDGKSVTANPTTDYNLNQFQSSGMQGYTNASYGYGTADTFIETLKSSHKKKKNTNTTGEDLISELTNNLLELINTTMARVTDKLLDSNMGRNNLDDTTLGYGLAQNDPRWANFKLGKFANGKTSTMATGGCGPTALAQVAGVNPMTVAKMAKSNGYISQGGANAGLMTSGANKLGLTASNAKSSYIRDLQKGKPVVISGVGSRGNSPFTKAGHIVTATGLTKRGDVVVSDPMTGRRSAYSKKTIDSGMTGAWSYSRKRRLGYGEAMEDQTSGTKQRDYNIQDVSYGRHVEVNSDNSKYTFYNEDNTINRVYYKSLKDGYYYQSVNGQSSEGLPAFPGQKITSESAMRSEIIAFCGRYVVGGKNLLNQTNDGQDFRSSKTDTIDGIITREKTGIYDPQRIDQDTKAYSSKYRLDNGLWWYPQKGADWSNIRYNGGSIGGNGSDIVTLAMTLSNLTGKAITPSYVLENMLPRMRHNASGTELNWNKLFSNTYGVQYLPEIAGGYKDKFGINNTDSYSQYTIPEGIEKMTVNQILSKYSENGIQKSYKFNSRNVTKSNYDEVVKNPALYMMQGHRYETSPFSMTDVLSSDSRSYLPEYEEVTGKDKNRGSILLLNSGATDINGVNKGMILAPSALAKDKGYQATNFGFLRSGLGKKRDIEPLSAPAWSIERLNGGFPLVNTEQDLKKDSVYSSEALESSENSNVQNSMKQENKSENIFDQLLDIFKKVFTIGMTKVNDTLSGKEYERIIDNNGNYLTYTDSNGTVRYKHNGESADGINDMTDTTSAIEIASNNNPTVTSSNMTAYNMSDLKVGDNMKVSKFIEAYAKDKDLYHKIAAYSLAASKQNEGEFYSINKNDNGQFSVGLKQWRGGRAATALAKMAEIVDEPTRSVLLKYANKAGNGPLSGSEASELKDALKTGGDKLEKFQYEYGAEDTYASELSTVFKMFDAGELKNPRSMIPIGAIANTGPAHVINWRKKWKDSPRNHHYEKGNLNEIDDVQDSLLSSDSWWGTRKDWHPYIKNATAFAKALPESVGFGDGGDAAIEEPIRKPIGFGPSDTEGGGNVSASTIINAALKEQGVTESPANSNKVKYNTEFYGSEVSGSAYPWCVVFPWWVFKHAGASSLFGGGQKFASCTAYMNWSKANGRWHDAKKGKPYPGDIAIMGFGRSEPKHMGLVIGNLANGKIQTIEGNTSAKGSQDNGGAVLVKERALSDFIGFDRPPYNGMGVVDKNSIGNYNYVNPTNEMSYDNVPSNFYTSSGSTTEPVESSNNIFDEFANVLSNVSSIATTRMSNAIIGKASDNVAVGYGSGSNGVTGLQDKLNIAVQADGVEKKLDVLIDVMKDFISNYDNSSRGATTAHSAKGYGEGGNTTNVTINKTIQNSNFRQSGNGISYQQQNISNLRKIHNQISR